MRRIVIADLRRSSSDGDAFPLAVTRPSRLLNRGLGVGLRTNTSRVFDKDGIASRWAGVDEYLALDLVSPTGFGGEGGLLDGTNEFADLTNNKGAPAAMDFVRSLTHDADSWRRGQRTRSSNMGSSTALVERRGTLRGPVFSRRARHPLSNNHRKVLWEILSLAVPALGTVTADPLMSLVDTACVGQMSAAHLASLGPNTAIFNFVFQLFSFLGLSIANVLAANDVHSPGLSTHEMRKRQHFSESMLCYTLTLAVSFGCLASVCLLAFGPSMLSRMGTSAHVMAHALPYLRVRALASPAVILILVAQGACLGQQDMWTPMRVVIITGLVNLIGDLYLILHWQLGTVGAAIATTAAQYAGAAFFMWYLHKQGKNGKGIALKWRGLPSFQAMWPMLNVAGVLLVRSVGLMLVYTAITASATKLGTVEVAAHQVALQVFWLLSYFPEPFSLTAQTLIARDAANVAKVRHLARLLLSLGVVTGTALALVHGLLLWSLPHLFSSDASVIASFQSVIPHSMLALLICSVAVLCDGVSIGAKQMTNMPQMLALSMLATFGMLQLGAGAGLGLEGVWLSMVAFYAARAGLHGLHVMLNWRHSALGEYEMLAAA